MHLLGVAALAVVYLNYLMLADYLVPAFLACVLAVLLRGTRDALHAVPLLERLKRLESRPVGMLGEEETASAPSALFSSVVESPLRKLVLLVVSVAAPLLATRRRQLLTAAAAALWLAVLVTTLSINVWWFVVAAAPLLLGSMAVMLLVLVPVNTLVALLLLLSFVVVVAVVGGAFATQVVMESIHFSSALAGQAQATLGSDEVAR